MTLQVYEQKHSPHHVNLDKKKIILNMKNIFGKRLDKKWSYMVDN